MSPPASRPDTPAASLPQRAIAHTPPGSVVLADGFPRSLGQAAAAQAALGRPLAVLCFDCSEDTMKVRDGDAPCIMKALRSHPGPSASSQPPLLLFIS